MLKDVSYFKRTLSKSIAQYDKYIKACNGYKESKFCNLFIDMNAEVDNEAEKYEVKCEQIEIKQEYYVTDNDLNIEGKATLIQN